MLMNACWVNFILELPLKFEKKLDLKKDLKFIRCPNNL